jgi:hypothetical protein
MTNDRPDESARLSRRKVLKLAVMGTGVAMAGSLASPGIAGNKVPKKVVNYQPTPKGKAKCSTCASFQPPSACKLVEGIVTPDAWCSIYAPKA